jgi:small-conductance mechanosensitive channel
MLPHPPQPYRFLLICLLLAVGGMAPASFAQGDAATVRMGDRPLFVIRAPLGTISPAERARITNERLQQLLEDPAMGAEQIAAVDYEVLAVIKAGDRPLIDVTAADADSAASQPRLLAEEWAERIRQAFRASRSETYESRLLAKILLGILYPVALIALLRLTAFGFRRLTLRFLHPVHQKTRAVRLKGVDVVSARRLRVMTVRTLLLARYLVYGLICYVFVLLMFSNFPQTKAYSERMLSYLTDPLATFMAGVASNLPRIGAILLIVLGVRFAFRLTEALANQVRAGTITFEPYLAPDMATMGAAVIKMTILFIGVLLIALMFPGEGRYLIFAALLLIALAVMSAFIPAATNMATGFMIVYMRLFRVGDTVTIGQFSGEIVEKTLLYVRLADKEGNEIIIPNRHVLSGPVVNHGPAAVHAFRLQLTTPPDVSSALMETLFLEAVVETPGITPVPPDALHARRDDDVTVWEAVLPLRDTAQASKIKASLYHRIMAFCGECGVRLLRIDIDEQSEA